MYIQYLREKFRIEAFSKKTSKVVNIKYCTIRNLCKLFSIVYYKFLFAVLYHCSAHWHLATYFYV